MRNFICRLWVLLLLCNSGVAQAQESRPTPFVHPGLLHGADDLARIKKALAAHQEPWVGGLQALKEDPGSHFDWRMRGPFATVVRDPHGSVHDAEMVADGNAAYENALMWAVTGDERNAKKAVEILDSWAATLTKMDGHDVQLAAGLNGAKFVYAAELMRWTWDGWKPAEVGRFQRFLKEVIYPPIREFAPWANGNWGGACIKTTMAIGVFCDDRALFDQAVDYCRHGAGDARLTHYVINDAGQCQESGRDQQHTQLGLGQLAEACEIAWHQGVDLYGAEDNRLLKGFEYTAKYNLGEDVPFVPYTDSTGKYKAKVISSEGRATLRPIYEMVWNHYRRRRGIPAPWTKKAADRERPEGRGHTADQAGFGTLMDSLPDSQTPARATDPPLPPDLPLPASAPSTEAWLRTANVLQPTGHSQFVALADPGDRPQQLKRDFGFNAIIVLPPDAHNAWTTAPADHLTEQQFRDGIAAYRKAGYRLILYTSVMAMGISPEFQSGQIAKQHPDWLQRDPKGNPVMVWGVPWLCPSTGARQAALDRCVRLLRDYAPDGIMLDNNEFYFAQAGWTCHCDACTAAFRQYTAQRCGNETTLALFGMTPDAVKIPDQEGPLFWLWVQWRKRVWAEVVDDFRARLRQIDPHIVLFANTEYLSSTAMLAADAQFAREDVVLSESVGLTGAQMSDKMVLGRAMAEGRPLWNYIGTFVNGQDYTGLRPASVIGPSIASAIAHAARPWIVDGFDLGQTDPIARKEMSRLLSWHAAQEALYQSPPWAGVATIISTTSRDVRHCPLIPPHLAVLRDNGTPVIALREETLTADSLRPFHVVTIERADCLSESAAQAVAAWVRAGGTLVASEETGRFDSLGRRREVSTLSDAFNVSTTADLARNARVLVPKPDGFAQTVLQVSHADSFQLDPASTIEVVAYRDGQSLLLHLLRHGSKTGDVVLHLPEALHPAGHAAEYFTDESPDAIESPPSPDPTRASLVVKNLHLYGVVKIPLR